MAQQDVLSGVCIICDENTERLRIRLLTEEEGRESLGEGKGSYRRRKVEESKRTTELENTLRNGDPEASSSKPSVNGRQKWEGDLIVICLEGLHPEGQEMLQLTGNRLHNELRKGCELKGLTQSKQW